MDWKHVGRWLGGGKATATATVVGMALGMATAWGQDVVPMFPRIAPYEDEYGSGGFVEVEMVAPADALVQLEGATHLGGSQWEAIGEPVLSWGRPLVFAVPIQESGEGKVWEHRFFRFVVQGHEVSLTDDGEVVSMKLGQATSSSVVAGALGRRLGVEVYPRTEGDAGEVWEPGTYEGGNLGALLEQKGVRWWVAPGKEDDERAAARVPVREVFQDKPLEDDPEWVGKGKIEDGFEGFSNLPLPVEGKLDPEEPGAGADKPLRVEIPEPEKDVRQEVDPRWVEPGRHLRLVMELKQDGLIGVRSVQQVAGDAWRKDPGLAEDGEVPFWPRNVAVGSVVTMVRSTSADRTFPEQIYHIGVVDDPFSIRSYDPPPPFRGSHGHEVQEEGTVRLGIPILEKDQELGGVTVELFRMEMPVAIPVLDPEAFLRNKGAFRLLGQVTGQELGRLSTGGQVAPMRAPAGLPASTVTQLFRSGPRASKFNFVVIGDGFANTTADQNAFNTYVDNTVMRDLLSRDVHQEILNGINIFRVNTFSQDSGITRVNTNGVVTTARNTALQYRYSGVWNRCWMEPGANSVALMNGIINGLVPEVDGIAVVLNVASGGGCARGSHFAVTLASGWGTFAHEFGHFFATQQDEYQCNQGAAGCGVYGGGELAEVNQTQVTVRNQIKWNVWIPSTRPVPTALANVADTDQDVGLFPGATRGNQQWWNGIFRPSWRGRMNNNTPPHNPVGYTAVRDTARQFQEANFRKTVTGDFDGDGRTDVVLLDDRQLSLYLARDRTVGANDPVTGNPPRGVTGVLEPTWFHTDLLRNAAETRSWEIRRNDILLPGDFDGDGLTDLYVVNLVDWNQSYLCLLRSTGAGFEPVRRYDKILPGWDEMRRNDEFYVGDFTGDGRDDLMVFNGRDWVMPYFGMLRSTGTQLVHSRRYDRYLPGWEMGRNEKFLVGDFNGDERMDVVSQNTLDWNQVHLMVFRSTGSALGLTDRYYGTIGGRSLFWTMRRNDRLIALNFDGDKTTDLAVFNGRDWGPEYLVLFALTEDGTLDFRRRFEDTVPGWDMRRRDRWYAADVNGDKRDDLVVFNASDWSVEYLGILRSNGEGGLSGSWQDDWIGGWNLGVVDGFHVAEFRGNGGWTDLFVYNRNWFGLLRSQQTRYGLEAIYPRWIHNHRYHGFGHW
jgi:hypothetical protein